MHHRHQIYLWNNEDFDESPLLWADQWSNEVPSWHDIQQLAPIDVEKRLSAEISRLRIENQRLVLQNHDLSVQLDNDPASIKQLQEELRQYVEDNGSVLITKETVQPNPVRVSGLE